MPPVTQIPVGYRAFIAIAAPDARPDDALHIEQETFGTKADACAWVEEARRCCADPSNLATCVVPVFANTEPSTGD